MRVVQIQEGSLEIRWTWLPYWMAVNPKLKTEVERQLRDAVVLGGLTTEPRDLDAMHTFVVERFCALFPAFPGLRQYLGALELLNEAPAAA